MRPRALIYGAIAAFLVYHVLRSRFFYFLVLVGLAMWLVHR